jgi:hypothetical protein
LQNEPRYRVIRQATANAIAGEMNYNSEKVESKESFLKKI